MIAYKGFNKDLESVLGNGKKECCTFEPGITYKNPDSKTARSGFHCCENPFECLGYYRLDGSNRFWKVEAEGDINEDDHERIACTEITLIRELSRIEFAFAGMEYMLSHPRRINWQQNHGTVLVLPDRAQVTERDTIAIARGPAPVVRGPKGSILGLIVEETPGEIKEAKLFISDKDVWMKLGAGRHLEEAQDEKEDD